MQSEAASMPMDDNLRIPFNRHCSVQVSAAVQNNLASAESSQRKKEEDETGQGAYLS